MGVGVSIFLIAVGALLAFAVDYELWWLDLNVAGWVLMVVGALGLLLTILLWNRRRGSTRTTGQRRDYHDRPGPPP